MTTHELLAELKRSGVVVSLAGDRLRVEAPTGTVTEDLRRLLVEHKPELMAVLAEEEDWRAEALEAERRFGHRAARLYPLIGTSVVTGRGRGRLLQVFSERVAVVLDREPGRVTYLLPSEVRPPGVESQDEVPFEGVH